MGQWWKKTVFYQIYMPSFCDGNKDGIGDFAGITSKLDYLKSLGVGGIWLTPFYPSPKVDQGYDVSDYYGIDQDYGTMDDFETFLGRAHSLNIRVIADVVINHTSTEHPWFLESKSSVTSPKRDWYVWKEPAGGREPNNWESFFGERAWEFDADTGMYYYHSFAKEQADLNWANPEVKQAVFEMLDFWADKGIDGFRLDVINNLSLTDCMTDNPFDEKGEQIHKYDVNQKGIHAFMQELKQYLSKRGDFFLVGEISSDKLPVIHSYTGSGGLDTTFNFNLGSMERFEFSEFYQELSRMGELYRGETYPTIFFGSHDMARFPSRFHFSENQIKNLFTLMMSFRAIPFLYFGDEIGMKNYECKGIEGARDIQGILAYHQAVEEGKNQEEAVRILNEKTRDHSRNTMYWDDSEFGGFSETSPWIPYQKQEGESAFCQAKKKDSLFAYVSGLIRLRTENEILYDGTCSVESPANGVIMCRRDKEGQQIWAVINFSKEDFELKSESFQKEIRLLTETNPGACAIGDENVFVKAWNSAVLAL